MTDNRTLAQLAAEALQVQDSCNLSGVVHSWSRSIKRLRELFPEVGTDQINQHCINFLFCEKVTHLTRNDMNIYIMRGIPGSGKTTFASKLSPVAKIISADHFFLKGDKYEFNPAKLQEAHAACLRAYIENIQSQQKDQNHILIVDNTNIKLWQIAPYWQIAKAYEIPVCIVQAICDPAVASRRNIHGVSYHTIARMFQEMDSLPNEWVVQFHQS